MRISDSQRFTAIARQLSVQQRALIQASEQVSSGKRWSRVSQDPVAGREVLDTDNALRAIAQAQRTIGRAKERLAAEENVLQQISDILSRVKELATAQGSANANPASRAATAAEVGQLRAELISLGNLRVGGEFIFGGLETANPPFAADGSYNGTAQARLSSFGTGQTREVIHSGQQIFVDTGILDSLAQLETALLANDVQSIQGVVSSIDQGFDGVQNLLTEIGARDRTLDQTIETLDNRKHSLTIRRAELAEIPFEEAALNLATVQTALQAAYLATARIESLSLAEYLR
jgi:flagellar hook-associated protein 3 FlgL